MVNLVLKCAGMPSGGIDDPRFSSMIETSDSHMLGSGNERNKTGQAQTTFKKVLEDSVTGSTTGFTIT
jgi:hypothetical protein